MTASLVKNQDSFALEGAWLIHQLRCGCVKCLAPGHRNAASLPARAVWASSHRDVQPGSHKAKKQKPKPPYILPIQEGSTKGWKARDRGPCLNFTTRGMALMKCMELIWNTIPADQTCGGILREEAEKTLWNWFQLYDQLIAQNLHTSMSKTLLKILIVCNLWPQEIELAGSKYKYRWNN